MNFSMRNDEKAVLKLRQLYEKYGYHQFKMSKFEEYDLYTRNKDFLVSDSIITFNDTNGTLMALKPDVTLSIIKDSADVDGSVKKVYYNENVYRVPKNAQDFKEIMQAGLECIGEIDEYLICETLYLAAQSLFEISEDFILDISHMNLISAVLSELHLSSSGEKEVLKCIGEKNLSGIFRICSAEGASEEKTNLMMTIASSYGSMGKVIRQLKELNYDKIQPYIRTLETIESFFHGTNLSDRIHFDFSVIHDIHYYNGIVFKGFINHIPAGVLSGGQYDRLMEKMNRSSRAIGFAVYLDLLERLGDEEQEYDVDAVVLYDDQCDINTIKTVVQSFTAQNRSVSVQKEIPKNLRYKTLYRLSEGGAEFRG